MLLTLSDLGYVQQSGRRFRVGPKVLDLGYSYMSSMPLWQIAQPLLEGLSKEFDVSSSAAVLDGCEIVFAVRANIRHQSAVLVSTGTRQPAHVTAIGRVLLAHLDPSELEEALKLARFDAYTLSSITDGKRLRAILEEVRRQNYAIVDEEYEYGLRAIAVPLRNKRGEVVAAMNAAGSNRALELSYLRDAVLPAMYEAAGRIRVNLPS
jgi:IclR family pca regulon transcriptional regulator